MGFLDSLKKKAQQAANIYSRGYDTVNILDSGRSWNTRTPSQEQAQRSAVNQAYGQLVKPTVEATRKTVVNPLYRTPASYVSGFGRAFGTGQQGSFVDKLARVDDFATQNARSRGLTGDVLKDVYAPAIETGTNILSMGMAGFGAKQFAQQFGKQGAKIAAKAQLPTLAKNAGLNATQGAAQELYSDNPTFQGAAQKAALSTVIGTPAEIALGGVAYGAPKLAKQQGKVIKELAVGNPRPFRKVADPEVAAISNYRNQMGTGALMDDATYTTARQALQKAGIKHTDTKAIDDLLGKFRTYDSRNQELQGGYARIPGKKIAPDLSDKQREFINDYAEMLEGMDAGNGVSINKALGTRSTSNSPFYRQVFAEKGRAPTKAEWFEEARKQIESGKAGYGASEDYTLLNTPSTPIPRTQLSGKALSLPNRLLASPQPLPLSTFGRQKIKVSTSTTKKNIPIKRITPEGGVEIPNAPSSRMSQAELQSLYGTVPVGTKKQLKVALPNTERNIPVRKLVQQGDTVTATNVNPNIKATEKRYSLDENGGLVEDKTGAYSLFSDEEGKIKGFRIGQKYFDAKEFGDLSDVNDYGSTLATMRRNIERGFGTTIGKKVGEFLVEHQQQQATKMIERNLSLKQGLKNIADDLGISFGIGRGKAKKISAAIQDFGEKARNRNSLIDEFGEEMADKIVRADAWFKNQYDSLLNEMNSVLTAYGYDPVPKRANYYTHFQDESLWKKFGLKMQEINQQLGSPTLQDASPTSTRGKISNTLAGESEFTLPNKRFNPFALKRKGETHTSDAFQAFERYLNPTLNNIYMTPSITRARVLAKAVAQEADLAGKDANKILIQVKEWANDLAGKSNRFDRPLIDSKGGQMYLKASRWAQKKAGQNTIVGNLSTAIMQPIVLGQTTGKFGIKNTILAAIQEMSTAHSANAAIRQSQFMKRRYADMSPVTAGKLDRAKSVANKPLELVEETSARITWNAAHNDAIAKGLKGDKAIQYADVEAEKTLAGRSIGEKPELFRSKAVEPISMYQLEVNNFWQQFGKEMTKEQAAKTLVAAYGLNLLLQEATGRQVGFNPIDAAIDSYQETQKEGKTGKDKAIAIGQRFTGEAVDNTPFIGPLANAAIGDKSLRKLLGPESNVGRFGVSSPISALTSTTKIGGIPVPQNLLLPFGGSQFKKTIEGIGATRAGQVSNKKGETEVNIPQSAGNFIRGGLFGKNAIPEVNQYYSNLGKKKTDQLPVPNQLGSKAGTMGLQGLTKDQQEQYLALPETDKEAFRNTSIEKNKGNYFKEQSKNSGQTPGTDATVEKTEKARLKMLEDLPQGMNNYDIMTLERFAGKSADEKNEIIRKDAKAEYKLKLAEYERDKKLGRISEAQDLMRSKELKKAEVSSNFPKEVRDLYKVPKGELYSFLTTNPRGDELAQQLDAYDEALYQAKLIPVGKFATGMAPTPKKGRTGKRGSSARTGRAKKALPKGVSTYTSPMAQFIKLSGNLNKRVASAQVKPVKLNRKVARV